MGDMIGVIGRKGLTRRYSVDRTSLERFLRDAKLPKGAPIAQNNKYWINLKF